MDSCNRGSALTGTDIWAGKERKAGALLLIAQLFSTVVVLSAEKFLPLRVARGDTFHLHNMCKEKLLSG